MLLLSLSSFANIGAFEKDTLCKYLKVALFFGKTYFWMMQIPESTSKSATSAISMKHIVRHNLKWLGK